MRTLVGAVLLCSLAPVTAATGPSHEEFRSRRAALRKSLDGAMVLFGQTEGPDEIFGFHQDPDFYYLTGWMEPSAILVLTPAEEMLFLPHRNEHAERYLGKRSSAEDSGVGDVSGFSRVLPVEQFQSELDRVLRSNDHLYALDSQRETTAKLAALYPFRKIQDAALVITKLRIKKSPAEIEALQHAADVSVAAHLAAWKRLAPGLYEYQFAATLVDTFLESGCEGVAYAPIVGSGLNGAILHYSTNRRRMDRGEVVVVDAAAECSHYASDITRTVPVSGKFTPRERELYEVVLGAQKAAIAAVKPGAHMLGEGNSLTKIARDYIDSHGKDLHGAPLGKYFTHGLGHNVGLQVHDPGYATALEAGMVITIEPGVYIPEENIGIRIEDVVLVTENGARVLTAALPKEPDEIEKALAK